MKKFNFATNEKAQPGIIHKSYSAWAAAVAVAGDKVLGKAKAESLEEGLRCCLGVEYCVLEPAWVADRFRHKLDLCPFSRH